MTVPLTEQKLAELRRSANEFSRSHGVRNAIGRLLDEREVLHARLVSAQEALRTYARHAKGCATQKRIYGPNDTTRCTCGLDAVLAGTAERQEEPS